MSGERDLKTLLSSLTLAVSDTVYVFATMPDGEYPQGLAPIMQFHEAEGLTLIVPLAQAQAHQISYEFAARMITLNIHSSLEAVGFMAHISTRLAQAGIPVNPVAGFYHDHLFVPCEKTDEAIALLKAIA